MVMQMTASSVLSGLPLMPMSGCRPTSTAPERAPPDGGGWRPCTFRVVSSRWGGKGEKTCYSAPTCLSNVSTSR